MQTHSAKQEALEAIQRLPDTADMEEIMYRLYVLENIRRGQRDAANGTCRGGAAIAQLVGRFEAQELVDGAVEVTLQRRRIVTVAGDTRQQPVSRLRPFLQCHQGVADQGGIDDFFG